MREPKPKRDSLRASSPSRVRALRAPAGAALDCGRRYDWITQLGGRGGATAVSSRPNLNCVLPGCRKLI
jgi:hypothetical protein